MATVRQLLGAFFFIFLAAGQAQAGQPRFLIRYADAPGPADVAAVQAAGGAVIHQYALVPALAVEIASEAVDGLRLGGRVIRIEPDTQAQANDAELDASWQVTDIHADLVQAGVNYGAGVSVAILDTGADLGHYELGIAGGYDFVNGDGVPQDDNGHGTHVAGIIAAHKNASGMLGVAPGVTLYAVKVLDGSGSGYFSDIIAGLDWCVAHGIQVTNNSYGSSQDPGVTVHEAFDNAAAAGLLDIAAAGNSGNFRGSGDNVGYPGAYASVVAVAAVDSSNTRAYFSSTGAAVELAAPGVNIYSTWPGGGFQTLSGTSMATPAVVGAAALVWASGITDANGSGSVNDEVRNRLDQSATDLGAAGRDSKYGFGLVDVAAALVPVAPPTGGTLQVAVTTDKSVYLNKDKVRISTRVTDEAGHAVAGAAVNVVLRTAKGRTLSASGSTDVTGLFLATYTVSTSRDGTGVYQVQSDATQSGYTGGTGTTSFTVN